MQEIRQVAAAIDLRVRQLEAQGIKGPAIADHMFGCMAGLQRIYDTASDETLIDLSRRYPGFHHYASLMEALSEKNQAMMEAGTHPHGDLPVLPEQSSSAWKSCWRAPPNWNAAINPRWIPVALPTTSMNSRG